MPKHDFVSNKTFVDYYNNLAIQINKIIKRIDIIQTDHDILTKDLASCKNKILSIETTILSIPPSKPKITTIKSNNKKLRNTFVKKNKIKINTNENKYNSDSKRPNSTKSLKLNSLNSSNLKEEIFSVLDKTSIVNDVEKIPVTKIKKTKKEIKKNNNFDFFDENLNNQCSQNSTSNTNIDMDSPKNINYMEFSFKNVNTKFFEKTHDDENYDNKMSNNNTYSYKSKKANPLRLNRSLNKKFDKYSDSEEETKNNKSYVCENHMKDFFLKKEKEYINDSDEFNRTKYYKFSNIIKTNKEINLLLISIIPNFERYSKNKKSKFDMIYNSSYDGDEIKNLHKFCDGITNLLLVLETEEGYRFGGFSKIGFSSNKEDDIDNELFLFSLDKMKIYKVKRGCNARGSEGGNYLFGNKNYSLYIADNFMRKYSRIDNNYNIFEGMKDDYEINGGRENFLIKKLEAFKILN